MTYIIVSVHLFQRKGYWIGRVTFHSYKNLMKILGGSADSTSVLSNLVEVKNKQKMVLTCQTTVKIKQNHK